MSRRVVGLAVSVLMVASAALSGCSSTDTTRLSGDAARTELSSVVDKSIQRFDDRGGSETTSQGDHQYALIYDPSAPAGEQVVTADLADSASPAFGDVSAIAIHSMKTLLGSSEFANATVARSGETFTISSDAFEVDIRLMAGLIAQMNLSAGSAGSSASQLILVTYGITPEAQKIFDSVAPKK